MLTLPLPAPSLRTANRLPARRVLRIHNDLICIVLSPLRWVVPTATQIFSLISGRQWDVPVVPQPTFYQPRQRGLADPRVSWLTDSDRGPGLRDRLPRYLLRRGRRGRDAARRIGSASRRRNLSRGVRCVPRLAQGALMRLEMPVAPGRGACESRSTAARTAR